MTDFALTTKLDDIIELRKADGTVLEAVPVPIGPGGGITQLTGDVLAGPGAGSVADTAVKASGNIAGVYEVVAPMAVDTTAGAPATAGAVRLPSGTFAASRN